MKNEHCRKEASCSVAISSKGFYVKRQSIIDVACQGEDLVVIAEDNCDNEVIKEQNVIDEAKEESRALAKEEAVKFQFRSPLRDIDSLLL